MGRKKVSTTVYLTAEQVRALKELHERTRVPIAEYIRMGINLVLQQYSDRLPGQMSLFELNSQSDPSKSSKGSE